MSAKALVKDPQLAALAETEHAAARRRAALSILWAHRKKGKGKERKV